MARPRVSQAPIAIATDGSVVLNAYWVSPEGTSPNALIEAAKKSGEVVFVGIVVPARWRGRILADLDELACDTVGRLGLRALPRLRRRPRGSRRGRR